MREHPIVSPAPSPKELAAEASDYGKPPADKSGDEELRAANAKSADDELHTAQAKKAAQEFQAAKKASKRDTPNSKKATSRPLRSRAQRGEPTGRRRRRRRRRWNQKPRATPSPIPGRECR
jgi:hypothetical protein